MVIDVAEASDKVAAWRDLLPRVEPFYAVKCHDDDRIIQTFVQLGIGFDCASKNEIQKALRLGAAPDRIVYANPCKPLSHIRFAEASDVRLMTFDNHDELRKIADVFPDAQLLLRLLPDDSDAQCRLGQKYGAELEVVPSLLQFAMDLGLNVVGMAFHVGSGCARISAYSDAVLLARKAFDIAEQLGMSLSILDIGGGFPGDGISTWAGRDPQDMIFPNVARELNLALDKHFPASSGVRVIAEPGRYMVHSSCTLFVNVIARRLGPPNDAGTTDNIRYYVSDGVYGSFNNILYDHATVAGYPLLPTRRAEEDGTNMDAEVRRSSFSRKASGSSEFSGPESTTSEEQTEVEAFESSVWGPTCDGLDCVLPKVDLPLLQIGDWMYFPDMGAYTLAAAAAFNGFDVPDKVHVC